VVGFDFLQRHQAFIMEKPYLLRLPKAVPPVYQSVERIVDVEGLVNLDTNRYPCQTV